MLIFMLTMSSFVGAATQEDRHDLLLWESRVSELTLNALCVCSC